MEKKQRKYLESVRQRCLKTIRESKQIIDGDKILLGISGGKDSLILTELLASIKTYAQIDFTLEACHIKVKNIPYVIDKEYIQQFCNEKGIPFHYIETEYNEQNLDKNPCFYCSKTRRNKLFKLAQKLGCNKLAMGHHKDDAIETMMMNMIYHGNFSGMPYSFDLFEKQLTFIRPMLDITEQKLIDYAHIRQYPQLKTECPYDATSKRKHTRTLIEKICSDFPQARANLFNSMKRIDGEYLPK